MSIEDQQPSLPWTGITPSSTDPAGNPPFSEADAAAWESEAPSDFEEPPSDLLSVLDSLREEIAAEGTESRRTARRMLEALKQLGGMMDALSSTAGSIHDILRASQRPSPATPSTPDLLRTLVDFTDRIERVASSAANEPPKTGGWFASAASVERIWREDRKKLCDSIDILSSHAHGILQAAGLEKFSAVGLAFDPGCMEAQELTRDPSIPDHTVLEEFSPGWREAATGRVVRNARVRVSRSL